MLRRLTCCSIVVGFLVQVMNRVDSIGSPLGKRWHDVAYWGILLVACIAFWVMNCLTPFKEDDMAFTLIDGEWTPVRCFADVIESCRNHFVNTNHRLADVVPILFCGLLGKGAFNVCNTLVFGLLAHLLSLLCTHRRSILVLTLFLAVVGTCYPVPGETMLWLAGSANYMWAITLSLLLVYCLQRYQGERLTWMRAVPLMLFAFIAGGFNEATSLGFLPGLCLYYFVNRKSFNARVVLVLAGYLLGLLLIVSSPAAWSRAANGGIVLNLGLGDLMSSRWLILQEKFSRFLVPALAIAACLMAVPMGRSRDVKQSVWLYVFMCLMCLMFSMGILHERAYAPWVTVSLIIVAIAADALLTSWNRLRLPVIAVLLGLAIFTFGRGIKVLNEYKNWNEQIERQIVDGPSQVVLQEQQFDGYSRFIKLMNYMSTNYFAHEVIYRAYYGKKNVQFVNDSIFARYNEGRLLDGAQVLNCDNDHPDLIDTVYSVPGQNYVAILLKTDTLPATAQTARYVFADDSLSKRQLSDEEQMYAEHGIRLNYTPIGFYPLEYQGRSYLISLPPDESVSKMVFPLCNEPINNNEVTITLKE